MLLTATLWPPKLGFSTPEGDEKGLSKTGIFYYK